MHYSAKRGIAIACRPSVRPYVCLSVTLVDCDHIGGESCCPCIVPLLGYTRRLVMESEVPRSALSSAVNDFRRGLTSIGFVEPCQLPRYGDSFY